MDTITQGLLGAVVAQLGFRQRIGKEAGWVAAGTAVLPDLDLLISPILSLAGAEHADFDMFLTHRGLSHSLLIMPLLGLPVAVGWWWFKRAGRNRNSGRNAVAAHGPNTFAASCHPGKKQTAKAMSFWFLYLCVLAALFSGPLLDMFTSYGTQLFAPVTNRRFALDAVPIIDIVYTPVLIATLIVCFIVRKLKKCSSRPTFIIGSVGFGLSLLYVVAGLGVRQIVLNSAREYFERTGQNVTSAGQAEYGLYPQIPTIFVWRLMRKDQQSWTTGRVNVLFGRDLRQCQWNKVSRIYNEWVARAGELEEVKIFKWFTMGQTRAGYVRRDGRHVVEFSDMRYGIRPEALESLWSVRVCFDPDGNIVDVEYVRHHRGNGFGEGAKRMWGDLWRR